jgi:hypothetical protein
MHAAYAVVTDDDDRGLFIQCLHLLGHGVHGHELGIVEVGDLVFPGLTHIKQNWLCA